MDDITMAIMLNLICAGCGAMISYYMLKDIVSELHSELNALNKTNESLAFQNKRLESELKIECSKANLYCQISLDQKQTIDELKAKNIGLIKVNYHLKKEPKPENGYSIRIRDRQVKVFEMRQQGKSYRDIGKVLNISHTQAITDYSNMTKVN